MPDRIFQTSWHENSGLKLTKTIILTRFRSSFLHFSGEIFCIILNVRMLLWIKRIPKPSSVCVLKEHFILY